MMSIMMMEIHEVKDRLFSKLMHLPKNERAGVIDEIIRDLKWLKDGKLGS